MKYVTKENEEAVHCNFWSLYLNKGVINLTFL